MDVDAAYRGRFAPSPTGALHLGSLIAALAGYLDARANRGQWLLRMEDLDPPREEPGAADRILSSLLEHGLHWDEAVLWQSSRAQAYQQALDKLAAQRRLFRCDCTRAMLGPGGACAGRCLPRQDDITEPCALRVQVPADCRITFIDGIQGKQSEALGQSLPDFVLRRKDGLYAYQLAVVVDDAFQQVNHIWRGSDLLDSTCRQLYLQQLLELERPRYSHHPVIANAQGQKLSKQNHAPALRKCDAPENLRQALAFLQQPPPPGKLTDCSQILGHAAENWSATAIPRQMSIIATQP
ncbi:tRNA glutamyl-Q(34) synthetase GluQRS [Pseudohalioglobus lutimaris]|uniref:Glutamyl-Q tRNA(Asp) synthetase n=1 Tax=Pseudohalioglobus lutimaris TaxID=1737061 RepID=A0A2N5X0B9_9GAMM|nr:tRNA glutamyl-Q(34) synthetase GluQRS [Pseudohalioglobus lutimaris]PLW67918.1 tRNA glutamyl-Q(34) synthetase GluQRS [Pseudohalioglobus lutimaris]